MRRRLLRFISEILVCMLISANAHAALTSLASVPLVTSSNSAVLPNIMFVLDDSGSMAWDYLPDWANGSDVSLFNNNGYNGVAYNPAVTYSPPYYFNADGTVDSTTYPSQTAGNTSNWSAVKIDGYGKQSTGTANLVGNAYYYTFIAGEYCSTPRLTSCVTQAAPSASYPYPATLRWCTSSALTSCQAVRVDTGATTYTFARTPKQATTTITVSGSVNTSVTSIKVNNLEILSAATTASTTSSTVASRIATNINACTSAASGSCQVAGYSASVSSSTVTITAPSGSGAITYTPAITKSGTMTVTAGAFSGGVPGQNIRTDIVSSTTSYPYPGTSAKASTRTDCAGTTCSRTRTATSTLTSARTRTLRSSPTPRSSASTPRCPSTTSITRASSARSAASCSL